MQRGTSTRLYVESVGIISLLCLALFTGRIIQTGTLRYWFIPENLALAWMSLILSWVLVKRVQTQAWRHWKNVLLSLLWLSFLPNTWYVMTDFIHVYQTGEINELYDIALITSLIISGFLLGLASLFAVHRELKNRLGGPRSYLFAEVVLLLSSFAIYLGRDLRWSTWDILTNPGGIILNVTDRIVDPLGHHSTLSITGIMFITLSAVYLAFWRVARSIALSKNGR